MRSQRCRPARRQGAAWSSAKRSSICSNAGSAAANCDELRDALAEIDDARVRNPVLVKLERGAYDCGLEPIALKRFVTIEGAGRNFSRIIGEVCR